MPHPSFAEHPWVRLLMPAAIIIAVGAFGLYVTSQIQTRDIEVNISAINSNAEAIASNAETLATVSQELPLIRQALELDQQLISVVIDGVKEDLTALNNRLSTYIGIDNEEQANLADRLHDLEMQVNVHSHGGTGRQDRGQ